MARVETVVVPKPEFDALVAQRDTFLAALREIAVPGSVDLAEVDTDEQVINHLADEIRRCKRIARTAIAEVEPMMHGTLTFDPKNSEVEGDR